MDKKKVPSVQDQIAYCHSTKEHHTYAYLTVWSSLMDLHHFVSPSVRWYFLYLLRVLSVYTVLSVIVAPFVFAQLWNYSNLINQGLWYTLTHTYPFLWMSSAYLTRGLALWFVVLLGLFWISSLIIPFWHLYSVNKEKRKGDPEGLMTFHVESRFQGRMGPGSSSLHIIDTLPKSLTHREMDRLLVDEDLNSEVFSIFPPFYTVEDVERLEYNQWPQPDTEDTRAWKVWCGRLLSLLVFASMLVVQVSLNYSISFIETSTSWTHTLVPDSLASIVLTLINIAFEFLSYWSTKFEYHKSITNAYSSFFLKVYVFQTASLIILSGFGNASLFSHQDPSGADQPCTLIRLSSLYTTSIVSMMVTSFFTATIVIRLRRYLAVHCCRSFAAQGDLQFASNFPVPMEHMDMLYKQFFLGLGFAVMPISLIMMDGVIMFEGLMDKIKLTNCAPGVRTNNAFSVLQVGVTMVNLCIIAYLWWTIWAINTCPGAL